MFHLPQKTTTYSTFLQRPRKVQRRPTRTETSGYLTSSEVAEKYGVSLRQLQWWDERGVVQPMIDRHARMYTETQARLVAIVAEFRRKGVSLQQIRQGFRKLGGAESGEIIVRAGRRWTVYSNSYSASAMDDILQADGPVEVVRVP